MRIKISDNNIKLWLSQDDTYNQANNYADFDHVTRWPCSELSGKRIFAEFDSNGLLDFSANGNTFVNCPADEFNAITSDYIATKLPKNHNLYFITVGQFNQQVKTFKNLLTTTKKHAIM